MKLRLIVSSLLLVILTQTAVWSGTTGKIVGVVKDEQSGEPLVGANVLIEGTSRGAVTDVDGSYIILNVPPGEYSLSASLLGYVKATVTGVKVSVDLTTTQDFKLGSTVLEVGKEVVVVAERPVVKKDLTSSEAHVDAGQIHAMPVHQISEVLQLQSGVTVDAGGGIHIRGGRTSEVAYWVDGVSLSDAYDGSQSVQVENNSIQELQVISGTFNAEYGQAMSGVVNIVTKDGDQRYHGSFSAYTGTYATTNGGLNNNRAFVLDGTQQVDFLPNVTYYNMNKIRPFDNRNFEGSLSGPIPSLPVTFYLSGRYYLTNGYLYGNNAFNPTVSSDTSILYAGLATRPNGMIDTNVVKIRRGQGGKPDTAIVGDDPVPMNDQQRLTGQAKLSIQFTPMMKLSLSGLGSLINYRDYNHAYAIDPYGDVRKYDHGYDFSALWTHTLNPTSFYTLNVSYLFKQYKEHLYASPYDTSYNLNPDAFAAQLYEYLQQGTNWHQFDRRTETRGVKFDYTDQVNKLHQVKLGVETKLDRLYLQDYSVTPVPFGLGYVGTIPDPNSYLYQEYTRTPVEFGAYVQDKLEYDRMVVNVGLRFDYFNSNGQVLSNPSDPNVYAPQLDTNKTDPRTGLPKTLAQRLAYWYKDVSGKSSLIPRLGISYPITDRGILHFSYGHFVQIPAYQYLYQSPQYKVSTATGVQGVYGNADLKPQKEVKYEIGLQQQVSENVAFDATVFYTDVRDWVSTSSEIPVRDPATATTWYTMFINRDYENVRGVTLNVTKRQSDMFSVNLSYTYQVAEAQFSNPDEEQGQLSQRPGLSATLPVEKTLNPVSWDQTHTLNLTLGVGEEGWGVFALGRFGSGYPYTPVINQATSVGYDVYQTPDSRRQPYDLTVDLRTFKNVRFAGNNVSIFLKVYNLFDRRNATTVYGQTGTAEATPLQLGAANITNLTRVNSVAQYIIRPDYYTPPREIQLGFEFNF